MAGICKSFALSCRAKRLAWATSSPDFPVVAPSGRPEGMGPNANACEEMALGIASQLAWAHIFDAALVNVAWGDVSCSDEVAEPLGGIRFDFVVVGTAHDAFRLCFAHSPATQATPLGVNLA